MKTLKSSNSVERIAHELWATSNKSKGKLDKDKINRLKDNLFKSKRELITQYFNAKFIPVLIMFLGSIGLMLLFYDSRYVTDIQNILYHISYCITLTCGFLFGLVGSNLILYTLSEDFYVDLICKRHRKYSSTDVPSNLVILSHSFVNDAGYRVPLIYGIDETETTTDELAYKEGILIEDELLSKQELKDLNDAQERPAYRQALLILNKVLRQAKIDETKAKYGKHCI